ncbi:MAG: cysteine peptidase family C39 domain-containing protein, partial [Hyphomicrobiaceae bacterium]
MTGSNPTETTAGAGAQPPQGPPGPQPQRAGDSGLVCLALIAGHYRISLDPQQVSHDLGLAGRPSEGSDLVRAAQRVGLRARLLTAQPASRLTSCPLPAILRGDDGRYVVLLQRLPDGRLRLGDPTARAQRIETVEELAGKWTGELVLITRRWGGPGIEPSEFSFRWFLPSIWRYRKPLAHVLIASLFVQLFALATPLLFQVVIDKVLVHRGLSTLIVIVTGMVLLAIFDALLQFLRNYTLSHTA